MAPLTDWLSRGPPLRRLDLASAGVRSRGALLLLAALDPNTELVHLRLGKYVARRVKRELRARLRRNARGLGLAAPAPPPAHVAAILSVYRNKR